MLYEINRVRLDLYLSGLLTVGMDGIGPPARSSVDTSSFRPKHLKSENWK